MLVWPGIGEAYGMVYLEAQAAGTPVVAEDHPGPRAVIGDGSRLVEPGNGAAFARAVQAVAGAGAEARTYACAHHGIDAAAERLRILLGELA